jgi:hypothetical protein
VVQLNRLVPLQKKDKDLTEHFQPVIECITLVLDKEASAQRYKQETSNHQSTITTQGLEIEVVKKSIKTIASIQLLLATTVHFEIWLSYSPGQ